MVDYHLTLWTEPYYIVGTKGPDIILIAANSKTLRGECKTFQYMLSLRLENHYWVRRNTMTHLVCKSCLRHYTY